MASAPSHGGVVALSFTIVMTVVATLFIVLRFWSRRMTRFGLWWDDWFAIATLVCLYAVLVLSAYAVYVGGIGKPLTQALTDNPNAAVEVLKALYGFEFAYLFASPLMKIAVLAYYWRMFPNIKSIRLGIWILSAICAVWFVGVLFGNLLECVPISYFWRQSGEGYCRFPATKYYVVVAIPNMVIDLFTVVLPIWEIWHLKLSFWKRIGVCSIFFIGGIVVVASIVRLALLVEFDNKGTANLTEDLLLPWFSTVVEIGVAIIGSCLPCLLPLYRRVRYGSPDSRPTGGGGGGYGSKEGSRGGLPPSHKGGPRSRLTSQDDSVHGHGHRRARGPFASAAADDDDEEHAFERLSTIHTKTSSEEILDKSVGLGNNLYRAKASGGGHVMRTSPLGSDDDIPLEGISVQREIMVHRSDSKGRWVNAGGI